MGVDPVGFAIGFLEDALPWEIFGCRVGFNTPGGFPAVDGSYVGAEHV